MIVKEEELINNFNNKESSVLHLKVDENYYEVIITYVALQQDTDYVTKIEDFQTLIQFNLFSSPDFMETYTVYTNIFRLNEFDGFTMQTMRICFTRISQPNASYIYTDLFPPKLERKNSQWKNIRRLNSELKSFDSF